jgi:hypothetical protein
LVLTPAWKTSFFPRGSAYSTLASPPSAATEFRIASLRVKYDKAWSIGIPPGRDSDLFHAVRRPWWRSSCRRPAGSSRCRTSTFP